MAESDAFMNLSAVVAEDGIYIPSEVVEMLRRIADRWDELELRGTAVTRPTATLRQYANSLDVRMMEALTQRRAVLAASRTESA